MAKAKTKHKPIDKKSIVWAIIITIIFTLIFSISYYNNTDYIRDPELRINPHQTRNTLIFALTYMIMHPIIGKILFAIFNILAKGIDKIYSLGPSRKWSNIDGEPELVIILAALWPISGTIAIPVVFIGLIFGLLFKQLFKSG
jgi:hypothetical protein